MGLGGSGVSWMAKAKTQRSGLDLVPYGLMEAIERFGRAMAVDTRCCDVLLRCRLDGRRHARRRIGPYMMQR